MKDYSCSENYEKINCIINQPSDFVKANMIHLQEIGEQQLFSSYNSEGGKDCYLFLFVTNGKGKLKYKEVTYTVSEGYCALLSCQNPYDYYPTDGKLTVKYIYFAGFHMKEIYEKYISNGGIPCFRSYGPKMYIQEWEQIYTIASEGIKISSSIKFNREEKIVSSFSISQDMEMYTALVSLTTSLVKAGEHARISACRPPEKRNIQDVKDYLERNYQEKISLDDLAEMFFINKFSLTRLFRGEFGISVGDYLIQMRLSRAKSLLGSSNMSVREIGNICGFKNINYFCKIFKKWEGISPGEFQRINRGSTS